MARKKSKEQIHKNMSRVRNSDTALEKLLCEELVRQGLTTFARNNKTIFGKPDIAFLARKIAIFCDGDFWHGYNWEQAQNEIKSNRDFWIPKIERNIQYRVEEYTALSGEVGAAGSGLGDFSREEMDISEYDLPHIKAISLVDKVRVVNALIGFSRIQPAMTSNDVGFVDVREPDTRWYPAYEVRGEGIFIEFSQEDIDGWIEAHPAVVERAARLNHNYATSFIGKNHPRTITPKFLMLHTLSHLLISQLSFECGYSIASLSERLYCAEESDGKKMAGIFIYTASGDAEGTFGGLVRQGRPDAFPRILRKAIANAKTCSNDPVCIMSRGQGRDSLNLAACHACGLLPETCCEERSAITEHIKKTRLAGKSKAEVDKLLEDGDPTNDGGEVPEELEPWRRSLAEVLHSMNPYAFERLAMLLLRECGFSQVRVTKKSGDGGIDGTGKLRINGIFSFNVAFQCKRYTGSVSAGDIRDFRGSLTTDIEKGVFITAGTFTRAAREEASNAGK